VLFSTWVVALCWRVVINSSYERWVESESMSASRGTAIFMGTLSSTYLLLCWSGLYFGIKYYETLQEQRESMLRASALAQEAQVKMLRYQLNPHFLFNTLNAISTLILDNQGKIANQAVRAPVRFPALYARPGPDEKGHAAAGTRRPEPVPRHRAVAVR
jgi:hypothetical protein